MRARLFARFGPEAGLEVEFGAEATIGRGKDSRVLLSSREVSQQHARVFFDAEAGGYWIEDLGSLNGTRLDGEPVTGRQRLSGLHVLSFGGAADLFFLELDAEAAGAETAPVEPSGDGAEPEAPPLTPGEAPAARREGTQVDVEAPTLPAGLRAKGRDTGAEAKAGSATRVDSLPVDLPPSLAGGGDVAAAPAPRFALEVLDEPGGRFELRQGDNLVGRSGRARIVLAHRELSRRHATLRVAGGGVWLRDEDSRNHTFVGEEEISEEVEIQPGAELRFGRLRARLVAGDAEGGES